MVRIGATLIDTDSMSIDELTILIDEFRRIRARKRRAEELANQLEELVKDAKEEGFTFIEKDFGYLLTGSDYIVYDEQK